MSEWNETPLNQIGSIISGGTPNTGIEGYWNGDIPFVTPYDLSRLESAYIEKTERNISKDGLLNSSANLLPFGSIIISSRAPIGYFAIAKVELTTNQGCKTVVPKSNFDSLFLYYCLSFYVERIKKLGAGSTFAEISKGDLELVKFPHPTKKTEQHKIAHILSTADAVIEESQAAIAKYKAIKQGMLHDLFTRGIDPATNKLRPAYNDAPHLYKESKLGWIPKEWEVEEFKNICDLITDGSHFSPTPIEGGAIIVNVKDIGEFGIDYESCTRISFEEFSFLKKQNCSPISGDVLLSKDGTIGRVVLFNDDREIVVLSSIAILRPSLLVTSEYLYSFLKSEYFSKQTLVKTSGSALKRIVLRDINTFLLAYPQNRTEQKNISNGINKIEGILQTEQTYLQKMQQIKAGLMSDLLSGKKEVRVEAESIN